MHYNTLGATLAPVESWQEIDLLSLYQVFEQLTDRWHPRGKRYRLALVLSLLITMTSWIRPGSSNIMCADWNSSVLP